MSRRLADRALELWLAGQPEYVEPDVGEMRAAGTRRAAERPPGPQLSRVRDLDADGVPVRLYAPGGEPPGLLVYLHGGGRTIGSIDTHDVLCRTIAVGAGVRVLSVGYRLAPEHPWPASVDDAVAVMRWVATGPAPVGVVDPGRLGIGGDSAGGLLAALACLRLRDGYPSASPDVQVLLCPNADLAGGTASMREKATGFALDTRLVRFFNTQWVPDRGRWGDPEVSPLRAVDLTGLPGAVVVTAEHDPLRDEGEAYARRLAEAGVTTTLRREPGVVHNAVMLADVSPACGACLTRVIDDVRRLLGG